MKVLKVVLTMIVLLLVRQPGVVGQDFDALFKAVQTMETNLKELVCEEASARTSQITGSQNSLQQAQKAGALVEIEYGTDWSQRIADLTAAVSELRADLNRLQDQANRDELSQELAMLGGEAAALQEQMLENRPALASTDEDSYAMARTSSAEATPEEALTSIGGIEWSGFFDVVGTARRAGDDDTQFGLGQAEIDLASVPTDDIEVEVAVAYNTESGAFELGTALVAIHIFNGEGRHVRPTLGIDHSFILAGQFDVPFGIDYHTYASIDRKLVTVPAVVELTHGGWNDYGVQFGLEAAHGNLVCYWVNGFESSVEVLDEVQTLATGTEVYEVFDTSPANAFGTRFGLKPFGWLELGGSLAGGWNVSNRNEMTLVGLDIQLMQAGFELKGELIVHSLNRSVAEKNNRGYYVQGLYSVFDRAFVVVRYGSFEPDQQEWLGQGSLGFGYSLTESVELRWESSIYETGEDNETFVQLVAGF